MKKKNKLGFTLIEMLVVVLIIGILAGIALPQYSKAVEKAKSSEALIILKSYRDQQAICYLEKGQGNCACEQGCVENDNIFTYANVLESLPDPNCSDPACGPATKDFSFQSDSETITAYRRPVGTKYYLFTTARADVPNYNRFCCINDADENWCKAIGFTKYESNFDWWCQP